MVLQKAHRSTSRVPYLSHVFPAASFRFFEARARSRGLLECPSGCVLGILPPPAVFFCRPRTASEVDGILHLGGRLLVCSLFASYGHGVRAQSELT